MKRYKNDKFPTGMSLLRYELKGSKLFFAASMLLSAAVTLIDLINPRIISCVTDYIIGNEPLPSEGAEAAVIRMLGGTEHIRANLYIPALFVICIALAAALSRYLQTVSNSIGAERLVKRMRNTLFTQVDKLSMPWYGVNSTGDILQRCTSDVETVKQFVSNQLSSFLRIVLMIGLSLYFMFSINTALALIAGVFIPVIVGASLLFHRKIGALFMEADTQEGIVSSLVQENLTGIRVVRAFGKEAYECGKFVEKNAKYTDMWVRFMRMMAGFWTLSDQIAGIQVMLVVIIGAVFCVNGTLTAGNYIAFISYNAMLAWPVRELGRTVADLSRAGVAINRIRYIMNSEPEDIGTKGGIDGETDDPLIEFSGVSYAYVSGKEVLNDINIRIGRGEKIGIIGGTGSGKSTLTDLLMRMCSEEKLKGTIKYRGKDIREYPLTDYRRRFSRVLQEPFLFSGTISENIGIARPGITDSEVKSAADDAELTPAAAKFTDGFETFVGERGVTLSGGQKQRTAIAAALAEGSEVYIFDDAFSALDSETETAVRNNICRRLKDSTVIFIAHRISTIAGCDRIYVLDSGRIAAQGTHSELISQEGIYKDIYELQTQQ